MNSTGRINVFSKCCNQRSRKFLKLRHRQGYGEITVDKNILAYYRHERIVQDIAEFVEHLLLSTTGGENRKIMFQHFMNMFASRGVVEIALVQ